MNTLRIARPRAVRRIFSEPEDDVVERASCTWCAAHVGEACTKRSGAEVPTHAQRWRDLWNETHPDDRVHVMTEAAARGQA